MTVSERLARLRALSARLAALEADKQSLLEEAARELNGIEAEEANADWGGQDRVGGH